MSAAEGIVELIVRRPAAGEREVLDEAELDLEQGLVGDRWWDGKPADTSAQLTLMSIRALQQIELDRSRWPLAGDQLYVDLDLAHERLPAGTRLEIGSAVIEVTEAPHTGAGSSRHASARMRPGSSTRRTAASSACAA